MPVKLEWFCSVSQTESTARLGQCIGVHKGGQMGQAGTSHFKYTVVISVNTKPPSHKKRMAGRG